MTEQGDDNKHSDGKISEAEVSSDIIQTKCA